MIEQFHANDCVLGNVVVTNDYAISCTTSACGIIDTIKDDVCVVADGSDFYPSVETRGIPCSLSLDKIIGRKADQKGKNE